MDNVVIVEDKIAAQMKIDHCNAHVKELAMDSRYVSTLEKAKTSKVMAATAEMTAYLTNAIKNGLSGSSISLPTPVTMDNVVIVEDEIAAQMKIDHCNAHVKDPSKYPLMGEKIAAKTDDDHSSTWNLTTPCLHV